MNVVKTNRSPRGKRLNRTNKKGTEQDKCSIVLHINYKKTNYWALSSTSGSLVLE